MRRLHAAFAIALCAFTASVLSRPPQALAAAESACGGGSVLLCYVEVTEVCTAIDARTGQCTRWEARWIYHYYHSGPHSCDGWACPS